MSAPMMINDVEWQALEPLMPSRGGRGKQRLDDRPIVSALLFVEAGGCCLENLPDAYGNRSTVRSRRRVWASNGTLAKIREAGRPAVTRMRRQLADDQADLMTRLARLHGWDTL